MAKPAIQLAYSRFSITLANQLSYHKNRKYKGINVVECIFILFQALLSIKHLILFNSLSPFCQYYSQKEAYSLQRIEYSLGLFDKLCQRKQLAKTRKINKSLKTINLKLEDYA